MTAKQINFLQSEVEVNNKRLKAAGLHISSVNLETIQCIISFFQFSNCLLEIKRACKKLLQQPQT